MDAIEPVSSRNALKGKIVECFGNLAIFAKKYGISRTAMYSKVNGKSELSISDVCRMSELLGIRHDPNEIFRIFFCE